MVRPSLETPEMKELIAKLAAWPHGLGFLHLADMETIAIDLRVHPFVVDTAREVLATPEGRAELIEEVHRVRALGQGTAIPPYTPSALPPEQPQLTEVELIEAAKHHTLGLSFLEEGYPEAVAVIFGVAPSVVFKARECLKHSKSGNTEDQNETED